MWLMGGLAKGYFLYAWLTSHNNTFHNDKCYAISVAKRIQCHYGFCQSSVEKNTQHTLTKPQWPFNQTTMALNKILDSRYSPHSGLGSYITCTHIPLSRGLASGVNKPEEATSQLWDWPHTPAESFLQDEIFPGAITSLKSRSFSWERVVVSPTRFPGDKYSVCTEFVRMGRGPHWIIPCWTEICLWSHSNWLKQGFKTVWV